MRNNPLIRQIIDTDLTHFHLISPIRLRPYGVPAYLKKLGHAHCGHAHSLTNQDIFQLTGCQASFRRYDP